MNEYDIIIIGAGPAGLFCAINCAEDEKLKILLLEKNQTPGKKLLLSGTGSCNITHTGTVSEFRKHYGKGGGFTNPALNGFTPLEMIEFLYKNGIATTEKESGKIFPESMNAGDILSMLTRLCKKKGTSLQYRSAVSGIEYSSGEFTIHAGKHVFTAPVLVVATGGCSYPATGSTGDGYQFTKNLGHSIIQPEPALTPVYIKNFPFTSLSGVSVKNTHISLYRKNKKINSSKGDVLFTHKGLSGPGILDMSRYITGDDIIKISLTGETAEKMNSDFISVSRTAGIKSIKSYLKELQIPGRLAEEILAQEKIHDSRKISEINRNERTRLFRSIGEFSFIVEEKAGFTIAMATCGGVCRNEINKFTMESKIIPGLYFAGEVIDIDGDTGGYNIQWAFSSGKLAAENIKKSF